MTTQLYIPAIGKAITSRLQNDATLVTLLGAAIRITNTFPTNAADPPGTTYPFVSFYCSDGVVDESFDGRRHVVTTEFRVKVEERPAAGGDSVLVMAKIVDRIIGDFPAQSGTAGPSYGLDRWIPSFAGYTGDYASVYTPETVVLTPGWNDVTDMLSGGIREVMVKFDVGVNQRRTS